MQFLESLLEMWLEYESSIQALKSWMGTQEERLKRKPRIEDLTSVQNALRDCQVAPTLTQHTEGGDASSDDVKHSYELCRTWRTW